MSSEKFNVFCDPSAVALVGASDRPHSVGAVVMRNLLAGGFGGPILPVNPKHVAVAGVMAYPDVKSLPKRPDLAVICTPPATVPGLIEDLGRLGTKAAIVMTAGLEQKSAAGESLQAAAVAAARASGLRILGPNCIGLMIPAIGLNASFAHQMATPGKVAFVTQSGALSTAVLDYARSNQLGISKFVSLGNQADLDFGDVVEYLATDSATGAILLYIESVRDGGKFMAAARAASTDKPVLAVKAGRVPEGARAALSHTGAMAGSDDVFDVALRRAGVLRVETINELFDAVATLGLAKAILGPQAVILTNGGGPGVMATDALVMRGGQMAQLSAGTATKLDRVLPATWSHANPVDIIGDAPPERYVAALEILLGCPEVDAILFIHAPSAIVSPPEIARAMAPLIQASSRTVLSCWLGRNAVAEARQIFINAGIPTYDGPEEAVDAFLQLTRYRESQWIRSEAVLPMSGWDSQRATVRQIVAENMNAGRLQLGEAETKAILEAAGIPTVETRVASDPDDAERLAAELGCPVALKIRSPDLSHKSDVGGVVLDLETPADVRHAAAAMMKRLEQLLPTARLSGFTVQKMARRPGSHELIVGMATDPSFGPVILFGEGGMAVEVVRDRAIALPPLNDRLARELIGRTRVAKLLAGYRGRHAADIGAIASVLCRVSQLIAEVPELAELDINPLLADEKGVLALDARMRLTLRESSGVPASDLAPVRITTEPRVAVKPARDDRVHLSHQR
jgi:acetyltransferase